MKWENLIKIGVSGSRRFAEGPMVPVWLERHIRKTYEDITKVVIICGDAPGVDTYVEEWCRTVGIKNLVMHAQWRMFEPPPDTNKMTWKNPAGVIRNNHIVDLSDKFFAFWDGESPGTKDCIKKAKIKSSRTGMPVRVFGVNELRKALKIRPPVSVIVPKTASNSQARKITQWVRDAGLDRPKKKLKKKKRRLTMEFSL